MVQAYQVRRVIIVLVAVVLLVFIVAGIANLARRTFSSNDATATEDTGAFVLTDFDTTSSSLQLTYDGKIVAREDHRVVKISVSADRRVIEVLRGYDNSVITRKSYPNTLASYQTFIRAVNYEGFADRKDNKLGDDERGICPEGRRTVTELFNNDELRSRLWHATCSPRLGTLAGDARALFTLFKLQIPDYVELTRGLKL